MKTLLSVALLTSLLALTVMPERAATGQERFVIHEGAIEGRVTSPITTNGVADAQITLQGPAVTFEYLLSNGLYTPKACLTREMTEKLKASLDSVSPVLSPERVVGIVLDREANLLGLPAPRPITPASDKERRWQTDTTHRADTDMNGRFSFRNLVPGRYTLNARRDFGSRLEFVEGLRAPRLAYANLNDLTVAEGKPTPDVELRIASGGVITGRVRDFRGRALVNFPVTAYQIGYREGRAFLASVKWTETDDRGEYRLFWLLPGDYFIAADPRLPTAMPSPRDALVRTFVSGAIEARLVTPATAIDGGVTTVADIQVRADATLKISGSIVNPFVGTNGQPTLPSSTLHLVSRDPNALTPNPVRKFENRATPRSGLFEIRNVPPGAYDLWTTVPDGKGGTAWGHAHIEVSDRDLEDVKLAIKPGSEVKIRVTVTGSAPSSVRVLLAPQDLPEETTMTNPPDDSHEPANCMVPNRMASAANKNMRVEAPGVFTFPNVPEGRYRVVVSSLPTNAYVADIRQDGASVYDEGVSVAGSPSDIDVIVNTNGGTVKARVARAEAAAFVTLVPQQARRDNPALYRFWNSDTARDGNITGVPPGEYKAFAWERIACGAWKNAEFMAQFEERGKPLTVTAGAASTVDLTIIK